MSPDLREEVELELALLGMLLSESKPLFRSVAERSPTRTETLAVAAVLHSFYNGVENIFKRIAASLESGLHRGQSWHQDILNSMASVTQNRPAVISDRLRTRLKLYLEFRHFFRHAYTFSLKWERMLPLVLACEETLRLLETELDEFLKQ